MALFFLSGWNAAAAARVAETRARLSLRPRDYAHFYRERTARIREGHTSASAVSAPAPRGVAGAGGAVESPAFGGGTASRRKRVSARGFSFSSSSLARGYCASRARLRIAWSSPALT